jgi:hypothetical protein
MSEQCPDTLQDPLGVKPVGLRVPLGNSAKGPVEGRPIHSQLLERLAHRSLRPFAQKLGIEVTADRAERRRQTREQAKIIATYDYRDEAGADLFQTVRYEPKDFRQRRPDGKGGWIPNLDGVRRVLYRTPDLEDPSMADALVYIVEGEKDVVESSGTARDAPRLRAASVS